MSVSVCVFIYLFVFCCSFFFDHSKIAHIHTQTSFIRCIRFGIDIYICISYLYLSSSQVNRTVLQPTHNTKSQSIKQPIQRNNGVVNVICLVLIVVVVYVVRVQQDVQDQATLQRAQRGF